MAAGLSTLFPGIEKYPIAFNTDYNVRMELAVAAGNCLYLTTSYPPTVIPAYAGIQDGTATGRHTTNRAFLDSRLRGNDGFYMGLAELPPPPVIAAARPAAGGLARRGIIPFNCRRRGRKRLRPGIIGQRELATSLAPHLAPAPLNWYNATACCHNPGQDGPDKGGTTWAR